MSGWKTHQSRTKIRKKTKLALLCLGLLLILILFSQIIQIVKFLSSPISSDQKRYFWNQQFNLNMVFINKGVSLVSFSPKEKKITSIKIPEETYIEVPGGFGKWPVRSIYTLGETSGVGGENLVKESISSFFGLPVDGFSSVDLVDEFRKNIFSGLLILPNIKTNLTPFELLRLKINLLTVRFDKLKDVNLLNLNVLDKQRLPDGTEVFVADPIRLDSVLSDFLDPEIYNEHLSVAVFNAADTALLAQKAKRLITNLGGNVITATNASKKVKKSYVEGQDSKTLRRLSQIFDLGCSKDPNCDKIPIADLGPPAMRAQIIVVLGEDFK